MRTRVSVAVGLIVVGLVWIGQGTGLLPGSSFMVGDARWAAIGLAILIVLFRNLRTINVDDLGSLKG